MTDKIPKNIKGLFKVTKIGDSFYILLGKDIKKTIDLYSGKVLNIKIIEPVVKEITCPVCENRFLDYRDEKERDCPYCGKIFHDDQPKNITKDVLVGEMKGGNV